MKLEHRFVTSGLLACIAACGTTQPGADDDDGPDAPAGPHTIAEVGGIARLALAGDCIVVSNGATLACVARAGGEPRTIATFSDRILVETIGDGDGIVATSVPTTFGPADARMFVDRIGLDGTVASLAMTGAGFGAGEGVAVTGDNVVFTTGGNADLFAVPRTGGTVKFLASDSGNFGDLAINGTTAYYVNGFNVQRHDIAGPGSHDDETVGGCPADDILLAGDGTAVIAAGPSFEDNGATTSLALIAPTGMLLPKLPGRAGRLVAAAGTGHVIAGGDIYGIDLATGATTPEITGENAFDLLATPDGLVWITMTGAIRTQ